MDTTTIYMYNRFDANGHNLNNPPQYNRHNANGHNANNTERYNRHNANGYAGY